MEQTTINEIIFIEIEIGARVSKVMGTGSERGSSAECRRYVAVGEGNVGSGFCWI